ncbi:hypothetical protein B7L68_07030 [Thermoproteus sp. CP80]|nr:hypothetical protein B7L68_07030 [Thermoproteus sp. CP80]
MMDLRAAARRILGPEEYRKIRDEAVEAVAAYKRPRYLDLSDRITVLFEDAVTVWFQIEEALYAESDGRPIDGRLVGEAVRAYAPMAPRRGEVSMTLMVNLYSEGELRTLLPRYAGIERSVRLRAGGVEVAARPVFPEDYGEGALPRSIHYLKALMPEGGGLAIAVIHPAASLEAPVPGETAEALRSGLYAEDVDWAL